jgi:NTP pyrophosphatase (non-canonical NTP hydrolase)
MTRRREHYLFLGKRWGRKAESNIEEWGNQRHDTLLLALMEEVGEIAMAMEEHNEPGGGPHCHQPGHEPYARGRGLIAEMAELGRDTRSFLEDEYESPAGKPEGSELELHGEPKSLEPIIEEVGDTAALCYQLYWALKEYEQPGDVK